MGEHNPNSRLEAFCDGVFAIALTLLIIDIKLPASIRINNIPQFWTALQKMIPAIMAFILSFTIIFITWVNHHNSLKLVSKSNPAFLYANGFMLLTIVFTPFPTSLLGEYILTDHASPAVILYDGTLALQALAWALLTTTILKMELCSDHDRVYHTRLSRKFSIFGIILYSCCTIIAFWQPILIAVITILSWVVWLLYGFSFTDRHDKNRKKIRKKVVGFS